MIPIVELIRLEESSEGTFGVLKIQKEVFCVTLEPPDNENIKNISSIPAQQYICECINSPKFGITFEIKNVPGRNNVLFHAGNIVEDTEGCIILAQYFGKLRGNRAILNSGNTFKSFLQIMKDYDSFKLTIKEEF